ncbi:MAG: carboxypeptidase regulatory-like domain-containing protein [Patescibacteria group bacterium]
MKKGLTLVELIVSIFLFIIIGFGIWQAYSYVSNLVRIARIKTTAIALANEQIEIVRNLPYDDVGTIHGIPQGKLPDIQQITRDGIVFTVEIKITNIDDPFDGEFPNDSSPADYKLVEVKISCPGYRNFSPLKVTTTVAPKSLEAMTNDGALFIEVLNANGQPVAEANVHIENNQRTPPIIINDTTNDDGWLKIIGAPPGFEAYEITVTKPGYSTERTYKPGEPNNPNPIKPHATVVAGQITQITFIIDKVSTLNVYSINQYCSRVGNVDFHLQGAKLIGTDPDVYKYSQDHVTNSNGEKILNDLEWDNYSIDVTDTDYALAGTMPISPFILNPDTILDFFIVVRQLQPKAILVKVKDASTLLPLSGATVRMQKPGWDRSLLTGRGYLRQTDWRGGPGQENFIDETKYWSQDGNINDSGGEIKLVKIGNNYQPSGWLISSTFDTGASSNFYNILWEPLDQPPQTEVKFQIATSPTNPPESWNFLGPDGTPNTYYTLANTNIYSGHNGDRYLRYKVFLSTNNRSVTPIVSDIAITFSSVCIPSGQAFFYGLPAANIWTLTVSKEGYQTYTEENIDITKDWQEKEVLLNPE